MSQFNFSELEQHLNKLGEDFYEFVGKVMPEQQANGGFHPDLDIYEDENALIMLIDLPGMEKSDVQITVREQVLTVSGERKIDTPENADIKKRERKSGNFTRSFALPENVNSSEIKARFSKGILKISFPFSEQRVDSRKIIIE